MEIQYLNVGCGTHYANGWVNTDVWQSDTTTPDVVVNSGERYPFDDNTFDAIFLGHIIEHMPWDDVFPFMEDMKRIAKPGAHFLLVGPDVFKTIQLWKEDQQPWWMIEATMEHQGLNYQPDREEEVWDGAFHYWNCHEARIVHLLESLQFDNIANVFSLIPDDTEGREWYDEGTNITWPVVGKYIWQLAYRFDNPS